MEKLHYEIRYANSDRTSRYATIVVTESHSANTYILFSFVRNNDGSFKLRFNGHANHKGYELTVLEDRLDKDTVDKIIKRPSKVVPYIKKFFWAEA